MANAASARTTANSRSGSSRAAQPQNPGWPMKYPRRNTSPSEARPPVKGMRTNEDARSAAATGDDHLATASAATARGCGAGTTAASSRATGSAAEAAAEPAEPAAARAGVGDRGRVHDPVGPGRAAHDHGVTGLDAADLAGRGDRDGRLRCRRHLGDGAGGVLHV